MQIITFKIEKSKFQPNQQNMGKKVIASALQSMHLYWMGCKEINKKYFEGPIYC